MASVTIKVDGLSALGERMRGLAEKVNLKLGRAANNAGAQVIKKAAVAKAPDSDAPHKIDGVLVNPGNLKKNIVVKRVTKSALTAEHIVTVRGKKKDGFAARYGRIVEHGSVKMSGRPYLRPALESNKAQIIGAVAKKLSDGLKKAGA